MPFFKKKPVRIEAVQFTGTNYEEVKAFTSKVELNTRKGLTDSLLIHTLEGSMVALPGDWIIKGVEGEVYPCKPQIFEKTYDADPVKPSDSEEDTLWDNLARMIGR